LKILQNQKLICECLAKGWNIKTLKSV